METGTQKSGFQELLGSTISKIVLWGTVGIALTGIWFAYKALDPANTVENVKSAFSILQYVFSALLPLWGTWIGTILAYYYSQKNFEAANNSVKDLVEKVTSDKKLETVKSSTVMIPLEKLIYVRLASNQTLSDFTIPDMIAFLDTHKIRRVIMLDENNVARYSIHKTTITGFISKSLFEHQRSTPTIPFDLAKLTLDNMYRDPELKRLMDESVKTVPEDSNLLIAKKIMEEYHNCQDVFLTKTGQRDEPVIGWITNVTIYQNLVV